MASGLRRWGLRTRVTAAFAFGALVLSLALSGLTYTVARGYLLRQRESVGLRNAYLSARLVNTGLRSANPDLPRLLNSLETEAGSRSVIFHRGEWFASTLLVGPDSIPQDLRRTVADGGAARQLHPLNGEPALVVGVPLPSVRAQYFELVPLGELDRTLRILGAVLGVGAMFTTFAGAAVGRWAASRLLRPLKEVTEAAAQVAEGSLDIRIDATEDKDLAVLAGSFNAMVDALQARLERDARFASDVSHELRSPLTTLSTSVDVMLSRRESLPERSQQALDLLAADVRRFERLVQDLLEISRSDSGAQALVLEELRLAELVLRAIETVEVDVEIGPGAGDAVVAADKRRIEQVVTNLATNALLHGGGLVRVGVERRGGDVVVQFDDSGPGVSPDDRERVFERFARGVGSDRRSDGDGVGLGLALVREHIRLHGGKAWVEDRLGGGARFCFSLPVVAS